MHEHELDEKPLFLHLLTDDKVKLKASFASAKTLLTTPSFCVWMLCLCCESGKSYVHISNYSQTSDFQIHALARRIMHLSSCWIVDGATDGRHRARRSDLLCSPRPVSERPHIRQKYIEGAAGDVFEQESVMASASLVLGFLSLARTCAAFSCLHL